MKAQLALRMNYRLAAVRKRHYMPHGSGARARAKFQFIEQRGGFFQNVTDISILYKIFGTRVKFQQNPIFRLATAFRKMGLEQALRPEL